MSFLGIIPFGILMGGILADRIGAPDTLIIDGITCILGSLFFSRQLPALKEIVYEIYRQKGIIKNTSFTKFSQLKNKIKANEFAL